MNKLLSELYHNFIVLQIFWVSMMRCSIYAHWPLRNGKSSFRGIIYEFPFAPLLGQSITLGTHLAVPRYSFGCA